MRLRHLISAATAIALASGVAPTAAAGEMTPSAGIAGATDAVRYEVYTVLAPVPAGELRRTRGGLNIAGLDIDFGAQVKTYINNVHVATTTFLLNDLGTIASATTFPNSPPAGVSLLPFKHDNAPIGFAGLLFKHDGVPIGLAGLAGMQGIAVKGPDGATNAFSLHSIGLDHVTGAVINTAVGQAVKQLISATLTINNFDAVKSNLLSQAVAHALVAAGAPDVVIGVGH